MQQSDILGWRLDRCIMRLLHSKSRTETATQTQAEAEAHYFTHTPLYQQRQTLNLKMRLKCRLGAAWRVSLEYIVGGSGQAAIDVFGPSGEWNAETKELRLTTTANLPMQVLLPKDISPLALVGW
eukprot:1477084-Rhodomonas_salina.1